MTDIDEAGGGDPVTRALARVVTDFGPTVVYSPARLRASLSDVLGSVGRLHRAQVDALEIAAEEQVASELDAGSAATAELEQRLIGRGLSPEMARYAVSAWRSALGGSTTPAEPVSAAPPAPAGFPSVGGVQWEASGRHTNEAEVSEATVVRSARAVAPPKTVATEAAPAWAAYADSPTEEVPTPVRPHRRRAVVAGIVAGVLIPLGSVGAYAYHQRSADTGGATDPSTWEWLPTDSKLLSIEPVTWEQSAPYGWTGSQGCSTEIPAPTGVSAFTCAMRLQVPISSASLNWRIADLWVDGPGTARVVDQHAIVYENPENGPYSATVSYRVVGYGVQAISTWTLDTACNAHFACGR
ncbi:MAG: hypothetical protein U0Q21_10920 [Dermatophilaceae bacterium]